MAIQCPQCLRQYDVTLFEYGRTVQCDCGEEIDLASGHVRREGGSVVPAAITPATREYIEAPHIAFDYERYFRSNELFGFDTQVLDGWLTEPCRLLDLGCGTGRHVVHFAERNFQVTGVDLSEHMLAMARAHLAEAGVGATLVHGDITELSALHLGRFEAALCMFSTLGMVYGRANRVRFLSEVREHLEPAGALACHVHSRWFNVWHADGRQYLRRALVDWLKRRPEPFQKMVDGYRRIRQMSVYVYSARELREDLARAGLHLDTILYLNRRRNAVLRGPFRGLRGNGFLVLARRA